MNSNKVLVLGDVGVAKSSLVNVLCGKHLERPESTIGVSINVSLLVLVFVETMRFSS